MKIYRCRLRRKNLLIFFVIIMNCATLYYIHTLLTEEVVPWKKLKYVVVHIDLKGAPPRIKFLKSMIPEMRKLGANALLMEYEDMFPYKNDLVNLSKPEHYKEDELKDFLTEANVFGLEIIPLIQTFGHMEFVLKLKEFKHLREDIDYAESICPSKLGTEILMGAILRQIIEFHHSVVPLKHIHIGCDEVMHINICDDCIKRGLNIQKIFFDHVDTVSKQVWSMSPDTTVLIWDDMMRSIRPNEWANFKPRDKLEPVYWWYTSDMVPVHLPLFMYHLHFNSIWVASAYKGADGRKKLIPNYKRRVMNTLSWLNIIFGYHFGGEKEVYEFKGIILTGWSRYSHFEPLCELLPVSYTSLISSLLLVNNFQNGVLPEDRFNIDKWQGNNEITFEDNFKNDYYKKVGCKIDDCILNSTMMLFNSVSHYQNFMKTAWSDVLNETVKPKDKYDLCYVMKNKLHFLLNDIKANLRPFYSSDVYSKYHKRSQPINRYLVKCLANNKHPP